MVPDQREKTMGILICGLNGTGKSTLGRMLADRIGYEFIDNEDLFFPKRDHAYAFSSPRSKEEVIRLLEEKIRDNSRFVFAAVKGDYGDMLIGSLECIVLIDVPKQIRSQRVRERSFSKFGERILPGGDLYDREAAWFALTDSRPEDYTMKWLEAVNCPVIRVDGTLPVEENIEHIVSAVLPESRENQAAKSETDKPHAEFFPTDDLRSSEILLRLDRTCDAQPEKDWVPAYYFSICLPDGTRIGQCDLRIGHNERLYIGGNIGYGIDVPYRGHHYAAKACELLLKLARKHSLDYVIITCDPDNIASSRTCQLAGGQYLETAAVPEWHNMYEEGMRQVMVYRFDLKSAGSTVQRINASATVRNQYNTVEKLNTRISIHSKYSTNRQGFGSWITSHYRIREGMSLLELGCGTGDMWAGKQDIIKRCSSFVLSDFSDGMLHNAKETLRDYTGIDYRIIDIQDILYEDCSFDIVIANMMLYHVPDLAKGLREVSRVLKDDGTFYCATYGENGMMAYISSLFRDYRVQNQVSKNFTLQNGEEKLSPFFSEIHRDLYEDALEVTDVEDMVDYIFSLTGMTDLRKIPRDEVRKVLENNMRNGILYVPKEYGLFIAKK